MKVYVDVFQAKEFRGVDCGSKGVYVAPFARFWGWQGEIRRVVFNSFTKLGSMAYSERLSELTTAPAVPRVTSATIAFRENHTTVHILA